MSAEMLFKEAAVLALKSFGPPVLEALAKVLHNIDKSGDPLSDAELAAKVTAAETSTVELLRLALRRTAKKGKR